ncbi:MAG: hypothetical protein K2X74_06470, partial [Acetobacteraceae bacterium]|nr:hypothetical protein [Acetobacteraceae bacterium]
MRAATGQALRWLQRLIRVVLPLALIVCVGLLALFHRLHQGPLDVPMLARAIERAVDAESAFRLEIGGAAIAWEGWRTGAAPLDIRLEAVRLRDPSGALRADLPEAAVTLSMRALLQGRLAPATVELRRPSLLLTREADGRISLGAGAAPAAEEPVPAEPGGAPIGGVIEALHRSSVEGPASPLAAFRRLRILDGQVLVQDRALGRRWSLGGTVIDIRRSPTGGLVAEGGATAQSIGVTAPLRITASMAAEEPPR